jgi:hypothetical protein
MRFISMLVLCVAAALLHLVCVQGAVRLTNSCSTPAQAKSGSFLAQTRVHQKMQNKMAKMNKMKLNFEAEGEHEGVEVTFLPTHLAAATVGDQISFGLLDGKEVNGEISSVTYYGSDRFVWSGTAEGGGSFYLSYAEGAIVSNVYYPGKKMQYEYRPLNRDSGSYSLRQVDMSVYDEEPPMKMMPMDNATDNEQRTRHLDEKTDDAILDVMVLFTNEAYEHFGEDMPTVLVRL